MQPLLFSLSPWLAAIVLMLGSAAAAAGEGGGNSAPPMPLESTPPPASFDAGNYWEPAHLQKAAFGQAVDPAALSDLRGGYDSAENSIVVDGAVDGNTANELISGANTISDGAFANANGLSTVIQNSGSNVLIQNAMIVKVDFGGSGP